MLTRGAPGPWGEAAEAILAHHHLAFLAVAQEAMAENVALRACAGHRNAPVSMTADDIPLSGWHDILAFTERMGSGPPLLPPDPSGMAATLGLCAPIAGPGGLGWTARAAIMGLMLPADPAAQAELPSPLRTAVSAYDVRPQTRAAAPARLVAMLAHLDSAIGAKPFFFGSTPAAADIYWATFSVMLAPLPRKVNPIPEPMWRLYGNFPGTVQAAITPRLLTLRDRVWEQLIGLPLDF